MTQSPQGMTPGPSRGRYWGDPGISRSRTVEGSYVSTGCAPCGALIGRFFECEAWYSENETVGEIELPIDGGLRNVIEQETQRWAVWEAELEPI